MKKTITEKWVERTIIYETDNEECLKVLEQQENIAPKKQFRRWKTTGKGRKR